MSLLNLLPIAYPPSTHFPLLTPTHYIPPSPTLLLPAHSPIPASNYTLLPLTWMYSPLTASPSLSLSLYWGSRVSLLIQDPYCSPSVHLLEHWTTSLTIPLFVWGVLQVICWRLLASHNRSTLCPFCEVVCIRCGGLPTTETISKQAGLGTVFCLADLLLFNCLIHASMESGC